MEGRGEGGESSGASTCGDERGIKCGVSGLLLFDSGNPLLVFKGRFKLKVKSIP